jgi:hypothetical protein
MFVEVTISGERHGVNVQFPRWVKKDGRIKFQEVWSSSPYLINWFGKPVLVGRATEERLIVYSGLVKRGGTFVCFAMREP